MKLSLLRLFEPKTSKLTFLSTFDKFGPDLNGLDDPPISKMSKSANFDNFQKFALIFLDEIFDSGSRNIRLNQGGLRNSNQK